MELFCAAELFAGFGSGIPASLINGDGVGGGENADILDAAGHGMGFAVASSCDVDGETDVDVFFVLSGTAGVLHQLFTEELPFEKGVPESAHREDGDRMAGADGKTGTAADTLAAVDLEFAVGV